MKTLKLICAAVALAACQPQGRTPEDIGGSYQVQQIAEADLSPDTDITFSIDAATGAMTGTTGCNQFSAQITSFTETLTVHSVAEQDDQPCATAAQQTDETRFLTVLPHITRFSRDEHRVVFFGRTPEQVLLLTRRE